MSSDIKKILKKGESERLEFRGAKAHIDNLAIAICGMLNQQGGTIVVGVDDAGNVVGMDDTERWVRELHDYVMSKLSPKPLFSAFEHELDGKRIVMIDVPQGADKPYSLNRSIYVRVGQATLKADSVTAAEIVEVQASVPGRWEHQAVPGFTASDCDESELATVRSELEVTGRFGMDVPGSDEELLRRLRLERSGQYTNAALLLFAKDPLAWSPNLSIRVVSYASDKMGPISNDTRQSGPAMQMLRDAITAVQNRTGFSGRFEASKIRRVDKPAYALFALREGLVNAIVHRDYNIAGGQIQIEIFPDRLVIQNPGKLPQGWEPDDLKKEHSSIPGNPDVARVFYLCGLMEQLGMGTQKLIAECKLLGSKAPVWTDDQHTVSLTLFQAPAPEASILLSERQSSFLAVTKARQVYKTSDYAEATDVVGRQAQRELGDLVEWGFFERQGKGPATVYVRTEKAP